MADYNKQNFNEASEIAFNEEHWQKLNYSTGCFESQFAKGKVNYRNMELEKQRAFILRNKSMMKLEKLLVDFETHFNENGGKVLWARNAADARTLVFELLIKEQITAVSRSNSMVLDEIELNDFLQRKNIDVAETSMARFVLQSGQMKPYHPLSSAIHLSKEEINGILTERYKLKPNSTVKQMVNFARFKVNESLQQKMACITGANFLLSEEGGIVLTENEGNILKSNALSKIHIVVAGIGKVIPNIDDLSVLLPLSSSHATGQSMAAYNSIIFGRPKVGSGPQHTYVILLDNGRSDLLAHEVQRSVMSCIHCGACVSVCPVYKNIGGYSYGTNHIGPVGSVMMPLMNELREYAYLTSACSLCGKCAEVCPVKIPLDDLMVENRNLVNTEKAGNVKFDAMFKLMIWHCKSRKKMDSPLFLKKLELKRFLGSVWGERRVLPEFAQKSFSQLWKDDEI